MKNFVKRSMVMLVLLFASSVGFAQTKVVVIPMAGADLKPLSNIVTVAKENGDFDDLNNALASITDASVNNPYLLVIAPGKYTLSAQAVIPEYVQVSGSGRYATILRATGGTNALEEAAAAIVLPSNAVISDLTLESRASSSHVIGIYLTTLGFLDRPAVIDNVFVNARGSSASLWNIGIYDAQGDAEIKDSIVEVQKTSALGLSQAGIYIYRSKTQMNNLDIKAQSTAAGNQYGVFVELLTFSEVPELRQSRVHASYGSGIAKAIAVYNLGSSYHIRIKGSILNGRTDAIEGNAAISYSSLIGGLGPTGTQRCIASDNAGSETSLAALGLNCLPIP